MTADHRAQVEDLLADYRRGRDQLAAVQQKLATLTETATSSDGLISATVRSNGTLVGLEFNDPAYHNYRPERLSALIVEAVTAAAVRAARTAHDVIAPVLPAGTDPAALLSGTADLTPAELRPPVVEESFENQTWLQKGGVVR